jgi:zinc protease
MSTRIDAALAILGEVLMEPAFPEREIERLKSERLAELLQLRAEPRGLADEMFSRFLYHDSSRFAKPEGGTTDTVESLTRDDVERFYDARYQPGGVTLIVVGDVSAEDVVRTAGATFESWGGGVPARSAVLDQPARLTRAVHIIAKADAPQSELRMGHVGLARTHPDFFPLIVMNAVLGGLFSSRINLNLRESHGYTYGAFSGYELRRQAGPFVVSTAVRSDVTEAAARETLREIDRIRDEEVSNEELTLATSYLDGVFPIKYETTSAIAAALATAVIYDLPDKYFDTYRTNIQSVTTASVMDVARKHLHPDMLQLVVVGDATAIREPLEASGFGPVEVIHQTP